MKRIAVIVIALSLAGCSSKMVWYHDSKTTQEFYSDLSSCEAQGAQAATSACQPGSYAVLMTKRRVTNNCLVGQGWRLGPVR